MDQELQESYSEIKKQMEAKGLTKPEAVALRAKLLETQKS